MSEEATKQATAEAIARPVKTEVKVGAAKGRPMLQWVGKRPLAQVTAFPAQLVETYKAGDEEANGPEWKDWPAKYPKGGLLFHGDNKEVLAHLLANGFRGKVNLIYIDPPFDSGADYVRKVSLRGPAIASQMEGSEYTLGEQIQYADIWANDNYLQFMYERLLLLKELLAFNGSIWLHCDYHKSHHVRMLMDEVFGSDNLQNEIIWQRTDPHNDAQSRLGWVHDTILWYGKDRSRITYRWQEVVDDLSPAALKEYNLFKQNDGCVVPYTGQSEKSGRRFKLDDCTYKGKDADRQFTWRGARPSDKRQWPYATPAGMDDAVVSGKFYLRNPDRGAARCRVSYLDERPGQILQTIWTECGRMKGGVDYPTQKPHALLSRIIRASSDPGDIVLDCFVGSGTTVAVAQKVGRRWIACDINKGAMQTSERRLQTIISAQLSAHVKNGKAAQTVLDISSEAADDEPDNAVPATTLPAQFSFSHWRVNDYDLQRQHNEAVDLACELLGVTRNRSDVYFDGTRGALLVKIVPFNHPLSPLDLEQLRTELNARPTEERQILLVCLGAELAARTWLDNWNRLRGKEAPNRIEFIELRTDPKYGKLFEHKPAEAQVSIATEADQLVVAIEDFLSPTILERLSQTSGVLQPKIDDWRSMVDCVLIDTDYDGAVFNIVASDIPEKKTDLVSGSYPFPLPAKPVDLAVKIIDMLGEEVVRVLRYEPK